MSGPFTPPPFQIGDIAGDAVVPRQFNTAVGELDPRSFPSGAARFDYFIDPDWKASDKFSVSRNLADGYARAWAREQDAVVREMLGRWVSELEPCLIVRNTHVVGLGMAGDSEARVVVRPPPIEQRATVRAVWPDGRPML